MKTRALSLRDSVAEHSSTTRAGQTTTEGGKQTDVEYLRKAAVKTTWGREHIKIVIVSFRYSQGTHEETRQIDIFVSQRTGCFKVM